MVPHNNIRLSGENLGFQLGANNGTIGNIVFNINNTRDRCLKDLRLTDPRQDKERIKDIKGGLLEDSYKWILSQPDFQRWRHDDDDGQSRLLWIKGDPGKGKTMLLIGIVDELERQLAQLKQAEQSTSYPTVLSYFFCQGTDSNLNNVTAVLRGLIFLLAIKQPSLVSHLHKKYEQEGPKLFEDDNAFFALSMILSNMLGDPSLARAYIVIDALDECETGFQQLLKLVVQNTSVSRVRWIVSSRNKYDIEQQLKPTELKTSLSLELKANAEHVSHAVGAYIDDRVSQLEVLQKDRSLRDRVRCILREKAGDTFLWVALAVQELKTVKSWDFLDVLEEMPMGLEELYTRMMKQIHQLKRRDPEYCRLVLSAATLAYRPLQLLELSVLSGLPKGISDYSERIQTIIRMCGSFLTMRDDKVYIVHQSAKDYLSGKRASILSSNHPGVDRTKFLTSPEAATFVLSGRAQDHRNIFLRSMEAMSKTLKRNIYGLRYPGFSIDNLDIPSPDPLAAVRYSCVFWVDHLCEATKMDSQSQGDLRDSGPVHRFLEEYLLYWIEASSLFGAMSDILHKIGSLERLLKKESNKSHLLDLTQDARRFILSHGWAIRNAPLQIYASALIFSPRRSITRKLFEGQELSWITTKPAVAEDWDPCLATLEGHSDWVKSVVFSPDGQRLASASDDKTVMIWNATDGHCYATLQGHSGWVESVAFSPDGQSLASASYDKTVKIWDAKTGYCQATLQGHSEWVKSVAFSPDGQRLASASNDNTVKIWDTTTSHCQVTLEGHRGQVQSLAFSPDGQRFVSASNDKTVKIWDVTKDHCEATFEGHSGYVKAVAFSPDGHRLASASNDKTVKIWDAKTGYCQATLKGHSGRVESVAFSPDGRCLVSASDDKSVKVWDAKTGYCQATLEGHGDSVPYGQRLALPLWSKIVSIWNAITGSCQVTLTGHSDHIKSVAFSPDGQHLASASYDKTIKIWDVTKEHYQTTFESHSDRVQSVAFSPDSQRLASASWDRTVKIWDTTTGHCQATLEGHSGRVESVAFSANGQRLVSALDDKTVKIWDAKTGYCQATLEGHSGPVQSVAFSPDDRCLALALSDKTVKIWDAKTGHCQATLEGRSGPVQSVAFSPDDRCLALALSDKTVKI
ncbi:hypothetical protein NW761_014796 [Fusarium oxysporum]|nr:hypothetical protein NW758_014906 [Fusarium oxysporum]KAJ4072578.1 hypothetical protein NW761_014796 [Fusarium oxysporum]